MRDQARELAPIEQRHTDLAAKIMEWGKFRDTIHVSQMLANFESSVAQACYEKAGHELKQISDTLDKAYVREMAAGNQEAARLAEEKRNTILIAEDRVAALAGSPAPAMERHDALLQPMECGHPSMFYEVFEYDDTEYVSREMAMDSGDLERTGEPIHVRRQGERCKICDQIATAAQRREAEIRLDEHQKSCTLCQSRIAGNRFHFQCERGGALSKEART